MKYPDATWYPSPVAHPERPDTWGIVIHWTAGHKAGDLSVLTGGNVDVQFYVTKAGEVYQLLDALSEAWHAFHTANTHCVGIEHEGSGEPWTAEQLAASAKLSRWLCEQFGIPVRHVDPPDSWRGLYGHVDLAHIDGNDHTDTVPSLTGWPRYLDAIRGEATSGLITAPYWTWLEWTLGAGWAKNHPPFDKAIRPKNWKAPVPTSYWVRRDAFLRKRRLG